MKKTQVALAALALVASTAALADGVTISGYADVGVQNTTGLGSYMTGGLLAPNVINFAGTENLGNGMKAEFFLQNRFEIPDGRNTNGSQTAYGNTFWNLSYIGLVTQAGTVQLGRNVDAFAGAALGFDVTGGGNMGSLVDGLLYTGASPVFGSSQIKYISPNLGGLSVSGSFYAADSNNDAGGNNSAKNDYSVAATYSVGAASLGGAYANRKSNQTSFNQDNPGASYFLGAGYDFGFAKVNLSHVSTSNNGSVTGINAAAPIPSIAGLTLNVGYYKNDKDVSDDGSSTSIGAKYALSKRTTLFANYQKTTDGYLTSLGTSYTQMGSGSISVSGASAFTVGVGHSF